MIQNEVAYIRIGIEKLFYRLIDEGEFATLPKSCERVMIGFFGSYICQQFR